MTRIERIDADLSWVLSACEIAERMECGVLAALRFNKAKRRGLILPANSENGTVQGAVATWWTRKSLPTRRQVATAPCTVPVRQQYQSSRRSIRSAISVTACKPSY